MRSIDVSTDVFSALWACRRHGEETENDILIRVLGVSNADLPPPTDSLNTGGRGYLDARYGVYFEPGFTIFRTYKGKQYTARVANAGWILEGREANYSSINALSSAVADSPENAWRAWNYRAGEKVLKIDELRPREGVVSERAEITWRDTVFEALQSLGGQGSLDEIYSKVRQIRADRGLSLPAHLDAVVRKELEINSKDSEQFQGRYDLFRIAQSKGDGVWRLK